MNVHNMKIGCGLEVRFVKERNYLYFWSYRVENGHSTRFSRYLGRAGREGTKRKALSELTAYYTNARGEMDRKLRVIRTRLAAL